MDQETILIGWLLFPNLHYATDNVWIQHLKLPTVLQISKIYNLLKVKNEWRIGLLLFSMKINLTSDLLTSVNKVIFLKENYLIILWYIDMTLISLTSELEITWLLYLRKCLYSLTFIIFSLFVWVEKKNQIKSWIIVFITKLID